MLLKDEGSTSAGTRAEDTANHVAGRLSIGNRDLLTKLAQFVESAFRPVYVMVVEPPFELLKGGVQVVMRTGTQPLHKVMLLHPNFQFIRVG
jgi:hypothetical protein